MVTSSANLSKGSKRPRIRYSMRGHVCMYTLVIRMLVVIIALTQKQTT